MHPRRISKPREKHSDDRATQHLSRKARRAARAENACGTYDISQDGKQREERQCTRETEDEYAKTSETRQRPGYQKPDQQSDRGQRTVKQKHTDNIIHGPGDAVGKRDGSGTRSVSETSGVRPCPLNE